ncbi:18864_t:CDS:2, partial [Racocetra fulgida]
QITEISISNSVHDPYITFPVTSAGIAAIPNTIDLLEFTQDPNVKSISPNKFLLKLAKDKCLELKFKFSIGETDGNKAYIKGLTFINVASEKELERIVTVEFNDDPNLHKHPKVSLVGNYESDGIKPLEMEWNWMWSAPHNMDEVHRGTGSLDGTSFLTGTSSLLQSSTSAPWSLPRSVRPSSPDTVYLPVPGMSSHTSGTASSISSGGRRSSDDLMFQHEPEDGPLFRATLSSYEKKTGSLRQYIKRILKAASTSHEVMLDSNEADEELMVALRAAATAHPQAFQPVLDSYLEDAAKKIANLRENLANQMSILLIEPLRKMYENDIKVADSKKKEFEDESRDYYQFLSKYLSMKVDSAKEKKKLETDSKYQNKRKTFELKRFDYYAYMQDLHGGRKDQEILYHLTNFAEKQFAFYQQTAMSIQNLKPGLDKLAVDVAEATKEIHLMRKEREERRRALETRAITASPFTGETLNEGENSNNCNGSVSTDNTTDNAENQTLIHAGSLNTTQNKFKGIRDLEQQGNESALTAGRRKEGFLFATSRATQHGTVDPIAKNNWHKEARGADRRFCFEVITPQYRRIYQAISAEDMSSWMAVISNAIESLLNGTSSCRNLDQVLTQDVDSTGAGT